MYASRVDLIGLAESQWDDGSSSNEYSVIKSKSLNAEDLRGIFRAVLTESLADLKQALDADNQDKAVASASVKSYN